MNDPVFDTVDFAEVKSRLRRTQGKLRVCSKSRSSRAAHVHRPSFEGRWHHVLARLVHSVTGDGGDRIYPLNPNRKYIFLVIIFVFPRGVGNIVTIVTHPHHKSTSIPVGA